MRIGINLFDFWSPGSRGEGVLNYTRGLLRGLAEIDCSNEYVLFLNSRNQGDFEQLPHRFAKVTVRLDPEKKLNRVLWEQVILPFAFRKYGLDLIHFPGGTASLALLSRAIVTSHAANLTFYATHVPEHTRGMKQFYIGLMEKLVTRSARLITDSEFAKQHMVRQLGIDAQSVDVVYLTVPDDAPLDGTNRPLDFPYILDVTSGALHKNIRGLMEAYALLKQRMPSAPKLVLAGAIPDQPMWGMQQRSDIERMSAEFGLENGVVIISYPVRERLIALYRHAEAFVFPSLFEGFGLAPLEAMRYGLPVVLSDRASLPEVGGDAAVYINPDSAPEIADALQRILVDSDLRRRLVESGFRRVEFFGNWKRVAQQTLAIYEQVFSLRKPVPKSEAVRETVA